MTRLFSRGEQGRATAPPLLMHWLILASALLLFGIAGVVYLVGEKHRTREREEERLLSQAHVIQENLGQNLLTVNQVLVNVRRQLPVMESATEFNLYLRALADAMPGARTLAVMNRAGDIVNASRIELVGLNVRQRDYFRQASHAPDLDTLYVSSPFHTSLGIYSITVIKAVLDEKGHFDGMVTATLDPEYFIPLLESVRYTPDMLASIVHWNGVRFLSRPGGRPMPEMSLLQPGTFFTMHRNGGVDATVFSGLVFANGQERMIAQRTVRPAGLKMDQPLVIAVSRMLDEIYAIWRRDIQILGAIYALISVLSILGLRAYHRKQVESAAREAEAIRKVEASDRLMKMVTDHLPGMVAYWTDELRCRFSNAAYLEWFGKTPEEMHDIRIQDLLGPELFAKNEPYIRAALRGERPQFERTLTKADGSVGYTWAQYIPDKVGDKVNGFVVLVADITRLKRTELALAESEWTLKTIIETEPECVAILSSQGEIRQINRAGLDMMEMDTEEHALGRRLEDLVAPEYKEAFAQLNTRVFGGATDRLAFELVGAGGTRRWLDANVAPMRDKSGVISGSLWVIRDFTDQKHAELELEKLAQTDFLTGLANRRHFLSLADKELGRTVRYGGPLSVLMIDIDHFKKINDAYGHNNGDRVLEAFAGRCLSTMRKVDVIGRLGGEEFAVVLPQTDEVRAIEAAERLRLDIAATPVALENGQAIHFTVSIGVASWIGNPCSIDTLLNRADDALYDAKNAGRNKVCVYKMAQETAL